MTRTTEKVLLLVNRSHNRPSLDERMLTETIRFLIWFGNQGGTVITHGSVGISRGANGYL